MINIRKITETHNLNNLVEIATECFIDDPFYIKLSEDRNQRRLQISKIFYRSFKISIKYGLLVEVFSNNNNPIAFASWIDFHKLKQQNTDDFSFIFPNPVSTPTTDIEETAQKEYSTISKMTDSFPLCLYLVSIAVKPCFRRKGIASSIVKNVINSYPHYVICSDISNLDSVPIYLNQGFVEFFRDMDFSYVIRYTRNDEYVFDDDIYLGVPSTFMAYRDSKETFKPIDQIFYRWLSTDSRKQAFAPDPEGKGCLIDLLKVSYNDLLNYQKNLDLNRFEECVIEIDNKPTIVYIQVNGHDEYEGINTINTDYPDSTESGMVSMKEYKVVPDAYIEIPMVFKDFNYLIKQIPTTKSPYVVDKMLRALDFRTNYEAGDPSAHNSTGFKARIKRLYLDSVTIQINTETVISFDNHTTTEKIGRPIEAPLILSYDTLSNCAVLTISLLSCSLPISQLIDSMSRNQLIITRNDGNSIPLFKYLSENYKLYKCGSPKCFITIFEDRKKVDDSFLSSLLFGETYYEDNTGLGKVVDETIVKILDSEYGMAQYNYATVYCYRNILIQMTSRFRSSINERIIQESITLFYMELIMFEECAIRNVEENISDFLNKIDNYNTSTVLTNINYILSTYAKSSDFWDIQMNYPSSRKSVECIRNAFQISKIRDDVAAKKETLLNICTIRDTILDETEGYFISIIGIIVAAFSCADLINSNHVRQIIGFILILICLFILLRIRMNKKIRKSFFK